MAVHLKLTQHCKSTILALQRTKGKKKKELMAFHLWTGVQEYIKVVEQGTVVGKIFVGMDTAIRDDVGLELP